MDEAGKWLGRRTGIDGLAVSTGSGWEQRVVALIDWQTDACSCPPGEHRAGCNRPRAGKVAMRLERPARALEGMCKTCDDPPGYLLFESELCRQRPGARHPLTGCEGCVFAAVGDLELDKSLVAALAPRPDLEEQIRRRLRARCR